MRKGDVKIIRMRHRRILLETYTSTITGTVMEQLEVLLKPYGYVKVNQFEIARLEKILDVILEERRIIIGEDERLQCIVSRRNWAKVLNNLKIVEK